MKFLLQILTTVAILYSCAAGNPSIKNAETELKDILYFGWFLNAETASSLQRYTEMIFRQLYNEQPIVQEFLRTVNPGSDHSNYFVKPLDPDTLTVDPYYHVTAMYCGDGKDCTEYYEFAKNFIGIKYETHLVGFYFTKRTFGVRIDLTVSQVPLFDMEESARVSGRSSVIRAGVTKPEFPGITFLRQTEPLNFKPTMSRAHITLGCAPEVPAFQAGLDLLEIVDYEVRPDDHEEVTVHEVGVLRIFENENTEKTAFVLYPYEELTVDATFQPYKLTPDTSTVSSSSIQLRQCSILLSISLFSILFR